MLELTHPLSHTPLVATPSTNFLGGDNHWRGRGRRDVILLCNVRWADAAIDGSTVSRWKEMGDDWMRADLW